MMGVEIERRFFLRYVPAVIATVPFDEIHQSYLSLEPCLRVRTISRQGAQPARAKLTVKSGSGIRRVEFEYDIPVSDADQLHKLAPHGHIHKRRYRLKGGWEVDQFIMDPSLEGLWLAEIELGSVDEPFDRPDWLGREVTNDPRYTNLRLAGYGAPSDRPRL